MLTENAEVPRAVASCIDDDRIENVGEESKENVLHLNTNAENSVEKATDVVEI